MELDFSQMALELSHHSYLLVTHLTTQEHCCHTSFHAYWYMNVMWSSRLFRVSLFLENASILMIWGCFSIVSNVIWSNYCCRRHTMHGNMVFSRESIFPTPQQSGCLCVCIANSHEKLIKSEIRSSSSRFEHCSESLIQPIGSPIWSLFSPIPMKSWPKVKLGKVQVGSNIAQNHSSNPYLPQFTWKVDQKWNYDKFNSVRTLLRIIHPTHIEEVISGHYFPQFTWKVKLGQVQVSSNIAQNTHLAHRKSYIWSLFAPIHVESWPKVKLGQVQVGSNIAQNHSSNP